MLLDVVSRKIYGKLNVQKLEERFWELYRQNDKEIQAFLTRATVRKVKHKLLSLEEYMKLYPKTMDTMKYSGQLWLQW